MFCAISGEVPQEPVVSSLTGHVYERRLIEKHIQETGKCPMSGEPMTMENLIAVKTNPLIKPRPPQATSVPSILTMLQLEWDALMLESHQMKTVLERTREELAAALYQNDAAKRVIARLIKERDDAKNAVANYQVGEQVQQEAA
ncbi:U box domain-containing protein, partial [Rozella allomycis CSF55]